MSRIAELLAELCPSGVEFKEIEDIFALRNGYTPSKSDNSLWDGGTIPWFRMEDIRENGRVLGDSLQHITEAAVKGGRLFPANSIIVATSATIGEHALITVPFLSNQRFTCLTVKPEYLDQLDVKFAYYYCFMLDSWCLKNTTTSSFASVDMAGFRRFPFPIPPVEVQQEISRVLDSFAAFELELEQELSRELDARMRQYATYRDSLLRREAYEGHDVAMGELGVFIRGRRFTKKDVVDSGIPSMHYGEIYTHYGVAADEAISHVRSDLAPQLRFAKPGDVVIAAVGETVEDVAKAVAWIGKEPVAIHDDTFLFRAADMNPKFVSYAMQSADFHSQKNKYVARAKGKRLSGESLAKITIPAPPRSEQDRVVSILDKFSALVDDLSVRLPAELDARRAQYEHYRDRLLSFEAAAS